MTASPTNSTISRASSSKAAPTLDLAGVLAIDVVDPTVTFGDLPVGDDAEGWRVGRLDGNFSETVIVASGTPTLTLNSGGTATYTGGTGTSALTFSYTVGAGQNAADLAVTAFNLAGATVRDAAGNGRPIQQAR